MDFAYWWSFSRWGSAINGATPSSFHQLGPLGRVGLVVAMSLCCRLLVPFPCDFCRGLSLALWSHDQFEASHWSALPTLLLPPGPNPPWSYKHFCLFVDKSRFLFKFVSVLLSASVKRVGVSRIWDFYVWYKRKFIQRPNNMF